MALNGISGFALDETPIAIIDFETTGLSAGIDRVVEVSVVRLDPGKTPRLVFDTLVNPMRQMAATEIHGITDQDVANAPQFADIVEDLLGALSGCVVAAYNVYFDMRFLNYELTNVGVFHEPPHFCLMYLRTMLGLGATCKLREACRFHGVDLEKSHVAAADALASGFLLAKYLETARERGIRTFGDLARLKQYKFVRSFANDPFPVLSEFTHRPLEQQRSQARHAPVTVIDPIRHAIAEYWDAIATIVTELEITESKIEELRNERLRLGLTVEQIRWAHAKAFAIVTAQSTQDRSVDDREARRLERVYDCLSKLGWAPGEGIIDPSHVEREVPPHRASTPIVESGDRFLIRCDNCQASLKVKRGIAGRQAKCPQCGIAIQVPAAPEVAVAAAEIRPATDRQKKYARSLGVVFSDNITRPQISELIDDAVERQDNEKHKQLGEDERRGNDAWEQVRGHLLGEVSEEDERVSKASGIQLDDACNAWSKRGFVAVLIKVPRDQITDFRNLVGVDVAISFCDGMPQEDVAAMIKATARTFEHKEVSEQICSLKDQIRSLKNQIGSLPEDE